MRFITTLFLLANLSIFAQKNYLLIGTYTKGKSEGIYVYDFDTSKGTANYISTMKTSNPSFLTTVQNKYVYAVNENDTGSISAYGFNKGNLVFLNTKTSSGRHPCYISSQYRMGQTTIIAGNYSSGNFILYRTDSTGALADSIQTIQHLGKSIHPTRQLSPHVHATVVSPYGSYLYVPDLGMDKVMQYRLDPFSGGLMEGKSKAAVSKAGSGPRHLCFHPYKRMAFLMEELTGTVKVYKIKVNGKLKGRQVISSHPIGYIGAIGSADIHVSPNGKFLYASNRGNANTIAIFSINQRNGKLTSIGFTPTLGTKPRNFNFSPDGNFLLVANQESDNVVIFKVDINTGLLTDTGNRITVPNPVCLVWVKQ
jgi:6-phosphogluconolactonase